VGDFVHIPTMIPPPKNLVFQHEVTIPTPTLGEREGRGRPVNQFRTTADD